MNTTAFDTLAYAKKLKAAGVAEAQAEAQAEALAQAITGEIATKHDISEAALKLDAKINLVDAKIDAKINLVQWMIGVNLALSVTILFKIFA